MGFSQTQSRQEGGISHCTIKNKLEVSLFLGRSLFKQRVHSIHAQPVLTAFDMQAEEKSIRHVSLS